MVEADVSVAGNGEAFVGSGEHRQLAFGVGQLRAVLENLLSWLDPRDMRVAENGQSVGLEVQHVADRFTE